MRPGRRLLVDPVACDGYGSCTELFPEWIGVDEWGYPVIRGDDLPEHLVALARRAVNACPKMALMIAETRRAR
ncbi:MAG TPA: ferredoxin [Acidimicrobiales bacterium]|nr:ferredoxin [Acidimicrobiales bacterium]